MSAEFVPKGGEYAHGERVLLPRREPRKKGRGDGGYGYSVCHRLVDRPAAFTRVFHVRFELIQVRIFLERTFGELKKPVKRLGGAFSAVPYSRPLESAYAPDAERILAAIKTIIS